MAKTSRELLTEAAQIISGFSKGDPGIRTEIERMTGRSALQSQAQQWLQEELSDEAGDSPSPSEEPPTDDRWMAAYLKGLEVYGRLHQGQGWSTIGLGAAQPISAFATTVADDALAAARNQAKESLAKHEVTQ
jgi:hypothetical protein